MKGEVLYEIIGKLCGPIDPVGDTYLDEKRLENLENLIDLAEKLLCDIAMVAKSKGDPRGSIAKAGRIADEFLREIRQE